MKAVAAVLVLLTSVSTYFSSDYKNIFYAFFIFSFLFYFSQLKNIYVFNMNLLLIPFGYVLATVISLLLNFDTLGSDAFQSLLYPLIFLLITIGGYRLLEDLGGIGSKVVISFFFLNGIISFLSIIGILSQLPLFGEITRGRYIFGTTIQSSAGLIWNVNYYSVTQLIGFWLSVFCYFKFNLPKFWRLVIAFIAFSAILGSSRSITLSLTVSSGIFLYFNSTYYMRRLLEIIGLIMILSLGSLYAYLASDAELSATLRIDRGLNGRDELWDFAFTQFEQAPWFGTFSIEEIGKALIEDGGLTNTTVQNTLLFTLLRLGIFGTIFLIAFVLTAISKFLAKKNKEKIDVAIFCCFLSLIFDSIVRSYSLGGVGLSSLILAVSGTFLMVNRKSISI